MRRMMTFSLLLSIVFLAPLLTAKDDPLFSKGVAYFWIGDKELARTNWELFFENNPDPSLRGAFMDLIKYENPWEATKLFYSYLDVNHRSASGLVGISIAISDMELSTSIENLIRVTRLDSAFSSAYLCLGMEYFKRNDYPQAKSYFLRALSLSRVPEYKILLARLYQALNQPAEAVNLLKPEADQHPDNFYFNYMLAESYFQLNRLEEIEKYVRTALEINPDNIDAKLLLAKFLLKKDDPKQAQGILMSIKSKDYIADYAKTYAQVLLSLKDKKCKSYLDEVFSHDRWDKDINQLMGQYFTWKTQGSPNVQNWINRAVLSGNDITQLKSLFPGAYEFPEYEFLPFFKVNALRWLSDDLLIVDAVKNSGEPDKLFFITIKDLKIMSILSYQGQVQDIFVSNDRKKIIFSTTASENKSVYIYGVDVLESSARLSLVSPRALPMASVDVGFNYTGTLAYITDKRLAEVAFESPFSLVSDIGEKTPVYPSYPFPIYQYNFATNHLSALDINDIDVINKVPIENVKKYNLVYEAHMAKSDIQKLIDKGKTLDLTSSEVVKIVFADDLSAFIIYLSDLKNAFQALIFDYHSNQLFKIDETMFIGTGNYAELTVKNFDPVNKTLLVSTKDEMRRLITFSYRTFISLELTDKIIESYYDRVHDLHYILTERSKKSLFSETNLEIITVNPYLRQTIGARRDLNHVLYTKGFAEVYFTTFTGELLAMDGEYKFHYAGPSMEDSLYAYSPSYTKAAAFIHERLYLVDVNAPSLKGKEKKK